jgi:hypothetical protein
MKIEQEIDFIFTKVRLALFSEKTVLASESTISTIGINAKSPHDRLIDTEYN